MYLPRMLGEIYTAAPDEVSNQICSYVFALNSRIFKFSSLTINREILPVTHRIEYQMKGTNFEIKVA